MFKGERTYVFWVGLILLGLSSVVLFTLIWINVVLAGRGGTFFIGPGIELQVPFFVGASIFLLIAVYMMKSGTIKH